MISARTSHRAPFRGLTISSPYAVTPPPHVSALFAVLRGRLPKVSYPHVYPPDARVMLRAQHLDYLPAGDLRAVFPYGGHSDSGWRAAIKLPTHLPLRRAVLDRWRRRSSWGLVVSPLLARLLRESGYRAAPGPHTGRQTLAGSSFGRCEEEMLAVQMGEAVGSLECRTHPNCRDIEAVTAPQSKASRGETGTRVHRPGTLDFAGDAAISPLLRQADSKVRAQASKVACVYAGQLC